MVARRVTRHDRPWADVSVHERYMTNLVTRNIERPIVDPNIPGQPVLPSRAGTFGPPDFASSYLDTGDKVLALFDVLWKEKFENKGHTLQYDLRDNNLALYRVTRSTSSNCLPRSVMLKGYKVVYKSSDHLVTLVEAASCAKYGETKPVKPGWDEESYQHIYHVTKEQIISFVGIETGDGNEPYSFILEITHSGLGLGHRGKKGAKTPLNGRPIQSREVLLESLADRVLVDIAVELREKNPNLLFGSCARLPDYTVDQQKNKANWKTSRLETWKDARQDERGISAELRAIHGGLYPQSNIVVADDPMAEMAARTLIYQEFGLDRRELLTKDITYQDWLARASGHLASKALSIGGGSSMLYRG
ncbi:hypothetical protein Cob_v013211 [Colletotrichum orbiculare MAFF 240422]|uniref:Uncharacterized protein n=1 Tax=Colletotrichum orbiculare (strain 104-T / ATCC 96160 / CBS 514.97 / LARS 414 / MAFF 240422) TaxID=1213857 RepID=N4VN62_COLOR|nr:hypothetical protein Cob_v013211 [Colletotrichum orbiculare MAFF 240422]